MNYGLEMLKLMADWSKWLAAIATSVLGGLFALLATAKPGHLDAIAVWAVVVAMVALAFSLWGACQFLFSMPRVVYEVRATEGDIASVLDRKGSGFGLTLRQYQRIQYLPLFVCAAALAVVAGVLAAKML